MPNPYLKPKWTMELLLREIEKICTNPKNQMPKDKHSLFLYTPAARRKLDLIYWAITYLLADKRSPL